MLRVWYLSVGVGFLLYVGLVLLYFQPPGIKLSFLAGQRPPQERMEALSISGPAADQAAAKGFEKAAADGGSVVVIRGNKSNRLRGSSMGGKGAAAGAGYGVSGSVHGVVILGMHRSGTSMVTGLLHRMGLKLGPYETLLGPQPGENDKGFFERLEVIHENDHVMRLQDVNWSLNVLRFDHLRALRAVLSKEVGFEEGRRALDFYNSPQHQPWAAKDPRLCITLKFWLPLWDTPPAVVLVYRHPIEVAKSLVRRKEFGLPRGLYLWIAYNRLAVSNSHGLCRVVANNADLLAHPHEEMARIHDELQQCGVGVPREASREDVEDFVDPKLRHHFRVQRGPDGVNLECTEEGRAKPYMSESAAPGTHEWDREEQAVRHAMRVFCALEDGSAFSPSFQWEDLPDFAPP